LFEPLSLILNLALFYAHQKTDSGQFEEEEGVDWPRAVLCFRLFSSSALSKDISNLFTWNFLKCLFGFKLIAPSTLNGTPCI
jgi:hypothetical protein